MLELNETKLASLRKFDDILNEKYGKLDSPERNEFDAKAKAWYYTELQSRSQSYAKVAHYL